MLKMLETKATTLYATEKHIEDMFAFDAYFTGLLVEDYTGKYDKRHFGRRLRS